MDEKVQGQGLGEILVIDAMKRIKELSKQVAAFAIEVDALNARAYSFYTRFGFFSLADDRFHMYLPLASLDQRFEDCW